MVLEDIYECVETPIDKYFYTGIHATYKISVGELININMPLIALNSPVLFGPAFGDIDYVENFYVEPNVDSVIIVSERICDVIPMGIYYVEFMWEKLNERQKPHFKLSLRAGFKYLEEKLNS